MKAKIGKIFNSKKYLLFCILIAAISLLFTSKNSFLFAFNDWVDANAFFTVGKGIINGVIPYRDIFEQKGLILYFIYALGYLINNHAFYGIYLIEIGFFSVFLYYAHKIFNIYLDKKYSIILIPILAFIVTTSRTFVHGGSCEEFILALEAVSLYYYFKHFKIKKLTTKETIINGMLASTIIMMKYTLIGLWAGFGLFILIDYLRNREYKKGIHFCICFGIGMLIPIAICFIYLAINHAIKEFIYCYLTFNMTSYNNGNKVDLVNNFVPLFKGAWAQIKMNCSRVTPLLLLYPVFLHFFKKEDDNKYFKKSLLGLIIIEMIILFWGLKFYTYYLLPLYVFIIISLLSIMLLIIKYFPKIFNAKYSRVIFILMPILFLSLTFFASKFRDDMFKEKKDYFQFKYADYINCKKKNATLLNMGFLDAGLYTTSGIVPNTKFFEVQNIAYEVFPDNLDHMKENVINKDIDYVLYYTENNLEYVKENDSYIFENYDLVFDDTYIFEGRKYNAFLFEIKN